MSRRLALASLLALLYAIGLLAAQSRVPLATEADNLLAPIAISRDGQEVTLRSAAGDDMRICVEPGVGQFGWRRCYRIGDVRAGLVVRK